LIKKLHTSQTCLIPCTLAPNMSCHARLVPGNSSVRILHISESVQEKSVTKPVMPVGFKASIPNVITAVVILSGCILMISLRPWLDSLDMPTLGYKPWFGMAVVFLGLIADVGDGVAARTLKVGTQFGSYFDELADLTAFGIGPAVYFTRHCTKHESFFFSLPFITGYLYMLASVIRISRELVVHRGSRPLFFVGITTNMASCTLVALVLLFEFLRMTKWLPIFAIPLIVMMVVPCKIYKDPLGLFISLREQALSMEEADQISKGDRKPSKPIMPVGLKAQIPNFITGIVILSGYILMVSTSMVEVKPWFGMLVVFMGLIADIGDGMAARKLKVGTKFGSYFDELADLTAFGIGPAVFFMRYCADGGVSLPFVFVAGYLYMLASVYRISRELVVHRGSRPLFFVGITTNMASGILVVSIFFFDMLEITRWLPFVAIALSGMMVSSKKFYKDPSGLFISFDEQKESIAMADKIEAENRD